jgi:hydrogenase maturation protease
MTDLREQLRSCLRGRVCLVGVGNVELGDDGFGVRLAEVLKSEIRNAKPGSQTAAPDHGTKDSGSRASFEPRASDFGFEAIVAGTSPERHLTRLTDSGFDVVLFLDALEFGAAPGSAVLLDASRMTSRFPQSSTHKLSLGLLAQLIEAGGCTRAWLIGVQPETLQPGLKLSGRVEATLGTLAQLLAEAITQAEVPA